MSDEIDINSPPKNLNSAYRRAKSGASEQTRRSPRSEFLDRIWKARGNDFSFKLKAGEKTRVLFLSEIVVTLAHAVIYKVDKFANREYVQCNAHVIPDDGPGWQKTGKPCAFCTALGDPRMVGSIALGTFDKFERKDGSKSEAQARTLIATQDKTINALVDMAYSDQADGSLKHLVVSVARGSDKSSCRVGETFIIQKNLRGKVGQLKGVKELKEGLKSIKLENAFGPISNEEMVAALRVHKKHCDENPEKIKHGYNESAMERAIRGDAESDDLEITEGATADIDPFEDLDDIEANPSDDEPKAEKKAEPAAAADTEEEGSETPSTEEDDDYDWNAV